MVVGLAHGNDPAVHDRERTAVDSFGDVNPICGFDQELRLINRWAVGGRSPGRRIISSRAMPFWMVARAGQQRQAADQGCVHPAPSLRRPPWPRGDRRTAAVMGAIPWSKAQPRPSAKATREQFPEASRSRRLDEECHNLRARSAHPFLQPLHEVRRPSTPWGIGERLHPRVF